MPSPPRDKRATWSQPAPSISAEGVLIDEWCASAAATLWADYVAARDAWGPPLLAYYPLSADDARLSEAYFKARAALAAWLIGCSERGEIELWARPGSRIEDARLIPPSAVRALTVDYKKRTAEGPRGEGLPRLYDVRVRQAAAASAPAASPAPLEPPLPAKTVSVAALRAALRDAVQAIVDEHPPNCLPPDDKTFHREVETRLGVQLPRDRVLAARDKVAPRFKRRVGRPRKSEQ